MAETGPVTVMLAAPQLWVEEFHRMFDLPVETEPMMPTVERAQLRLGLIKEEALELEVGLEKYYSRRQNERDALVEVADALADLAYVTYGMAAELGINLTAVLAEVHRSNMTKLGADGKPLYREDGKVLKPPSFEQPNIAGVLW